MFFEQGVPYTLLSPVGTRVSRHVEVRASFVPAGSARVLAD